METDMTIPRTQTIASLAALTATALLPALAHAQAFIRADSATATSVFSGSYVAANAINGSGMPAGFTPASPHATYVAGNHWTTRSGDTIGESATFSFNVPQSLGGFHMWAHRSNNIATNPHYAVTLFDLVLRDAGGTVLANLTGLTGVPNIQTAQTYGFNIVSNVSSVEFIVRATANNNSSPFTGLAEVAFADCIPASVAALEDRLTCPAAPIEFAALASGSGPFTYQWQWTCISAAGTPCAGWANVTEGDNTAGGGVVFSAAGSTAAALSVAPGALGSDTAGLQFRAVVEGACGSATTNPSTLVVCRADFNCDTFLNPDDLADFITCFFLDVQFPGGCPAADYNGDAFRDPDDLADFITAFFLGC
jgi:hypothetical protein